MYKTIWVINDGENKTKLTWYHFKKESRFPSWYMEEGKVYEIEMLWDVKLLRSFKTFIKCLFHEYVIQ